MHGGRIPFVLAKAIFRILLVQKLHIPVTKHLGQDGSRRDCRLGLVSAYTGTPRVRDLRIETSVDNNEGGSAPKTQYSPAHRHQRCPMDILIVYLQSARRTDRPCNRIFPYEPADPFPSGSGKFLGVADVGMTIIGRQHHRGGNDRPCQGPCKPA